MATQDRNHALGGWRRNNQTALAIHLAVSCGYHGAALFRRHCNSRVKATLVSGSMVSENVSVLQMARLAGMSYLVAHRRRRFGAIVLPLQSRYRASGNPRWQMSDRDDADGRN
jgi:hypothetical protein